MNAHHIPQSSVGRRPFRRPVAILGATVVTLLATAAPALAVTTQKRETSGGGSGPGAGATSAPVSLPAVSDTLSTAQVVLISLLVSLAVAVLFVGLAYVLRHRSRIARHSVTIPVQRTNQAASVDQNAMAFDSR